MFLTREEQHRDLGHALRGRTRGEEDGGAGAARETEKSLLRRLRDFLPDVFDTSWARSQWRQAWRVKL